MQKAWADFAKNPTSGPGWPRVGSDDKDLGVFTTILNSKDHLVNVSPKTVDRNCEIFQSIYNGRA
jgi:hypothetical protein